jgi:hypothetical protein
MYTKQSIEERYGFGMVAHPWVLLLPTIFLQAYASVNIKDSSQMKKLALATVRDSAAMKQVCESVLA